jgi:hypothetical protein
MTYRSGWKVDPNKTQISPYDISILIYIAYIASYTLGYKLLAFIFQTTRTNFEFVNRLIFYCLWSLQAPIRSKTLRNTYDLSIEGDDFAATSTNEQDGRQVFRQDFHALDNYKHQSQKGEQIPLHYIYIYVRI